MQYVVALSPAPDLHFEPRRGLREEGDRNRCSLLGFALAAWAAVLAPLPPPLPTASSPDGELGAVPVHWEAVAAPAAAAAPAPAAAYAAPLGDTCNP